MENTSKNSRFNSFEGNRVDSSTERPVNNFDIGFNNFDISFCVIIVIIGGNNEKEMAHIKMSLSGSLSQAGDESSCLRFLGNRDNG